MRVFVCYSRAQFYFAEDLVLALSQHDIDVWFDVHRLKPADDWDSEIADALGASDAVVLIASAEALRSLHVRTELDLARELHKPVVVALAELVELPSELADAPRVHVYDDFEGKVCGLSRALKAGDSTVSTTGGDSARTARPGVVWMVWGLLLASALLWTAVAVGTLVFGLSTGFAKYMGFNVVAFASVGAFCGWLWWAFAHRRAGSATLLGLAFAYGAVIGVIACGLIIYGLLGSGGSFGWLEALLAATVIWVAAWLAAGIWAVRSPAFYRWLPTGDAPRWMRRRMFAVRGHRAGSHVQPAGLPVTYDIRCHELDRSVERALDAALQAAGHRRVHAAGVDREILVLSDLTPLDGLPQSLAQLGARAVVVISAPISLAALEDVERYQWVDYRRRSVRTLEQIAATIGGESRVAGVELVPESLARRVVPLAVLAAAALCVFAASANLATGIAAVGGVDLYGTGRLALRAITGLVLGGVALWLAMALVARRLALRHFLTGFVTVYLVTVAMPVLLSPVPVVAWSAVPSAVLGCIVIVVCRKTLANWLPPRTVRANVPTLAAGNVAWWRRPAARGVALFTTALTVMLLVGLAPLADEDVSRRATYNRALMAANHYSGATSCLQLVGSQRVASGCSADPEQAWADARSALTTALEQVYTRGSPAGADAARGVEAVLPSSVVDAQRDPDGFYTALEAFLSVVCHELDLPVGC